VRKNGDEKWRNEGSAGVERHFGVQWPPFMGAAPDTLVAVVDDEESIQTTVGFALRKEGWTVATYGDGVRAWDAFRERLPDLAVLDIMMPQMDGLELCRRLRGLSEEMPIIFLTSRDEEFDRVLGLELGADDYLCKPFSTRELVARVKVLLRRLALLRQKEPASAESVVAVGALRLDLLRYQATLDSRPLGLTVTEFQILRALVRRPGHVKSRAQLMQEGYPHDVYVGERTIDSHIKRLRRKLTRVDPAFEGIETVHGLGYRYQEPR
jgi:two-component system response regulator ChvI